MEAHGAHIANVSVCTVISISRVNRRGGRRARGSDCKSAAYLPTDVLIAMYMCGVYTPDVKRSTPVCSYNSSKKSVETRAVDSIRDTSFTTRHLCHDYQRSFHPSMNAYEGSLIILIIIFLCHAAIS